MGIGDRVLIPKLQFKNSKRHMNPQSGTVPEIAGFCAKLIYVTGTQSLAVQFCHPVSITK